MTLVKVRKYFEEKSYHILSIVVMLFIAVSLGAWDGPLSLPPVDNTTAPINIGANPQTKVGKLGSDTYVTAPYFMDSDDNDYSVDPDSTSLLSIVDAKGFLEDGIATLSNDISGSAAKVGGYEAGLTGSSIVPYTNESGKLADSVIPAMAATAVSDSAGFTYCYSRCGVCADSEIKVPFESAGLILLNIGGNKDAVRYHSSHSSYYTMYSPDYDKYTSYTSTLTNCGFCCQ